MQMKYQEMQRKEKQQLALSDVIGKIIIMSESMRVVGKVCTL
jgi:hypothetical protein